MVPLARIQVDLGAACLDQADDEVLHDPEWVIKVCEQLRSNRFALIIMPEKYAQIYESLIEPLSYPCEVAKARAVAEPTRQLLSSCLPEKFLTAAETWAKLCTEVCKPVAQELLRLTGSKSPAATADHHEAHGMLRASFHSTAGPHYDNSFITLMGTGTIPGALQFSMKQSDCDADPNVQNGNLFEPCEHFIGRHEPLKHRTFVILAGVRICSPLDDMFRPLLHRVEYPEQEESLARINVIYFLRRFEAADQDVSKIHLEIHAFNRTVVNDRNFVDQLPHQCAVGTDISNTTGSTLGEEPSDAGNFDWNGCGLPFADIDAATGEGPKTQVTFASTAG